MKRALNVACLAALGCGPPLASAHDVVGGGRDSRDAGGGWGGPSPHTRPFAKSAKGKEASAKGAASKGEKAGKDAKAASVEGKGYAKDEPHMIFAKKGGKSSDVDDAHTIFAKSAKQSKSAKGKAGKSAAPFAKSGKGGNSEGGAWGGGGAPSPAQPSRPSSETTQVIDRPVGPANSPPTPRPTCNTAAPPDDFDLCIALDSSGSICSNLYAMPCEGCNPPILCGDLGRDKSTCCRNFATVKEFASSMVGSLEEPQAERSFSIVRFSTGAAVWSELASAEDTLTMLDDMDYIGGYTNHASAIQACQETFYNSAVVDNRKKFILLVTDGISTWPQGDPEGSAEAAAAEAKEEGATIIPVFISERYDEAALGFMQRLSSDGRVFDVTNFEGLEGLQESLVDQVSCS